MSSLPRLAPLGGALVVLTFLGCSSSGSTPEMRAIDPVPASDPSPRPPAEASSVDTDGWVWSFRSDPPSALYGPPASEAALVLTCSPLGPNRVEYTVYAPAPMGGSGELRIAGNGDERVARLGVTESELATGPIWNGDSPIEEIHAPFAAGEGPVAFTVVGGPTLVVPDPLPVRSLFGACGG